MEDLERFVVAQEDAYETAFGELSEGRKLNHWIWYIFPQLETLGYSHSSKFFGISDIVEARAYMDHPILGARYLKCVAALLKHQNQPIEVIMGSSVDAKKLRSSLTLMLLAGGGPEVRKALNVFYDASACEATVRELEASSGDFEALIGSLKMGLRFGSRYGDLSGQLAFRRSQRNQRKP